MAQDTGGASLFWTSEEPAIVAARKQVIAGELSSAETALRACASDAAHEGLQVIQWIRRDYCYTEGYTAVTLLASVGNLTEADIARWRSEGLLQHRTLDGEPCIFRSEPANLFRFCDEAKERRIDTALPSTRWRLEDHLEDVIEKVTNSSEPTAVAIRHEVDYELTVSPYAPGLRPGAVVRAWLPFPKTFRQQRDVRLLASSPAVVFASPEGVPHRSLYFEHRVRSADEPVRFAATFAFTTSAWCPLLAGAAEVDPDVHRHLGERPPHIVFTPSLRSAVAHAVGDAESPLERAHRIFLWVCQNIDYNAEEEYGIIPSLTVKALTTRLGDCGVQSMLFITMCRCAGIPARWQSGWQTQRVGWNMHDWCEIYIDSFGWIPVDPSYGLRQSDDPRVREFYFGGIDAYRMIVNTDYGRPLCPPKSSLRSEPLDFQRGEVEVNGENLYFNRWSWSFKPQSFHLTPWFLM